MTKAQILAYIKTKQHAVISTCGSHNHPEAALIGFGETDDFELIFGTSANSRKYQNLKQNNRVALVIGWDDDNITVQYEGLASQIFDTELEKYVAIYHQKVPSAAVFRNRLDQTYFKVSPTWVRYSDLSGKQDGVVEFSFGESQ